MSFIESYKRLDNLCKDLLNSQTGVTSYINSMEQLGIKNVRVFNWESDYQTLKRYRYIRNQIVHETYANEDNMCNEDDILWLEQFHERILNQEDPLALCIKASVSSRQKPVKSATNAKPLKSAQQNKKVLIPLTFLWTVFAVILAIVLCICAM